MRMRFRALPVSGSTVRKRCSIAASHSGWIASNSVTQRRRTAASQLIHLSMRSAASVDPLASADAALRTSRAHHLDRCP